MSEDHELIFEDEEVGVEEGMCLYGSGASAPPRLYGPLQAQQQSNKRNGQLPVAVQPALPALGHQDFKLGRFIQKLIPQLGGCLVPKA